MKLHKILTLTIAAASLTACSDDFLENKPQGTLSEGNMNNPEAIDLLVNAAYATFGCRYADSNDPHLFPVTNWSYGEVRADNAYKGGGGETDLWEVHDMETMRIQPNNGFLDGKWFNLYCGISRCNSAIRALRKADENIVPEKNARIAEVRVIRNHWYFELVRLFNRIPYMDIDLPENDYTTVRNDEFTREQHLARIAADLLDAAADLPDTQNEIGRINRRSALAYAAKVKLYQAYRTDADGLPVFDYQSLPDYATVAFAGDGSYSLANADGTVDPRLDFVTGRPTIRYKTYPDSPCGLWVRNSDVYGYNNTKRFWLSPESPAATQGWPWGASALNWQIIRYADLLLYKAEALIEIGGEGLEQARTLINRVRDRARNSAFVKDFNNPEQNAANYKIGLYPATGWTQDYARRALRTEMRLEKAMEGERFFDLVRWGIAKETMNNYFRAESDNRIYYQNATFDSGEEYFPVPVAQYNFSGGIYVQNPGYPAF